MNSTAIHQELKSTPAGNLAGRRGTVAHGLMWGTVGMYWLLLFDGLRGEWGVNPQYSYGWAVPWLGVALFWRLWPSRPVPSTSSGRVLSVGAGFLVLLLVPLRWLSEANPEWRLLYWAQAAQVLGLSFWALHRLGGYAWVRHFAPAFLFLLVAVPWPMQIETAVVQGLMRWVASLTVEIANWLGVPAVQHGNLVEVGAGMVGVDEACSGVRSLQAALMVSIFLGQLYRLRPGRRFGLVAASIALVLAANLGRTTFLVWAAARHGLAQVDAWHDAAGTLVMLVVLPGLFGVASAIRPRITAEPDPAAGLASAGITPQVGFWVGALLWIGVAELVTEAWYRAHERHLQPNPRWTVEWPADALDYRESELPEPTLTTLRCHDSAAASWTDDRGNRWRAFFLRWEPGKNSAQLAKGHRPEICLTAAGARLLEDLGVIAPELQGLSLPFRHQVFDDGRAEVHVFYCLWSDQSTPEGGAVEDGSQRSRLSAARDGRRHLGQQVLEVVIDGPSTPQEAAQALQRELSRLIRVAGRDES